MNGPAPAALEVLGPLLDAVRALPGVEERREAVFHRGGRELMHFHELPEGLVADVFLASGRHRLPVQTASEQADVLALLEDSGIADAAPRRRRGRRRLR